MPPSGSSIYVEVWVRVFTRSCYPSIQRFGIKVRKILGSSSQRCKQGPASVARLQVDEEIDHAEGGGDDEDETSDEENAGEQDNEAREKMLKQLKFPDLDGDHSPATLCSEIIKAIQKRLAKSALFEQRFVDIPEPLPLQRQTLYLH
ncbi:unnamed protein product [Symbiodinium sp. CCMP2456]|nr:unnamed protein product [Symbiodinium sp. CCMP2456]